MTPHALVPLWPDLDGHDGPLGKLAGVAAAHLFAGRSDLTLRIVDAGIWASAYGDRAAAAQLGMLRSRALLHREQPLAAAAAAREVLELLGRHGPRDRRADALAVLAMAEVENGNVLGAMDPLAEAMWLVRPVVGALEARPVARISAGLSVAVALLRLLLVECAEEVLPRPGEVTPLDGQLAVRVARCRARLNVFWGLHLEAAGDREAAADRFRQAEAASLAIVRHGVDLGEPVFAAFGTALEAFAAERLGRGEAALGRARAALAAGLAADSPEWQLGRLAVARGAAGSGDLATARTLVADVAAAGRGDPYSPWTDLVLATAAEIEAGAGGAGAPATVRWQAIATSGEGWIWDERQARAFDLRQRVARRELMERSDRTNRELLVDPLTGAGNRRRLDAELSGRRSGGVVFVDLDEFKQVNDRHGHAVGDLVLRRLAGVLRQCCREDDVLIRYGGDEFLILLGDGGAQRPEEVGRRVLDRVRAEPWAVTTGVPTVTVSVGTARGPLAVETVQRSDAAMFAAKRAGRDGMVPQ